jgi:hypothetical protein
MKFDLILDSLHILLEDVLTKIKNIIQIFFSDFISLLKLTIS